MSEKTKDWQPDPSVPATLTRAEAEERLSRLSGRAQAMGNLDNAYENLASFEACFVGGPPDCYTAWGILRAFVAGPDAPPRPLHLFDVYGGEEEVVIAYDAADAKAVQMELGIDEDDREDAVFEQLPDDADFAFREHVDDMSDPVITKTCAEWAKEKGRGFFATTYT